MAIMHHDQLLAMPPPSLKAGQLNQLHEFDWDRERWVEF